MSRLQYVGMSAKAKSVAASDVRLINGYSEIAEHRQGKSIVTVYRTPGLAWWITLPDAGGVRGLFYAASQQRAFAVQGNALYEVTAGGAAHIFRGSLASFSGPVQMEENGIALAIVDNASRYSLTFSTNAFAQNTAVDFPVASRVGFIDGYFLYTKPNGTDLFWSDLYSTDVQALNSAKAEGRPDPIMSLIVLDREAWVFGTETTQPFYSTGDADQPFLPIGSIFIPHGTIASQSPTLVGQTVCWLSQGRDGQAVVLQAAGQQVQTISTHAMAETIQRYSRLDDAIGWAQQQEQHLFFWLVFPSAKATWVLDLTTNLWHERGWRNPTSGTIERHRANCYMYAFGKHLVGDYENGRIYSLEMDTYSDAGEAQVLRLVLPPLFDGEQGALVEQQYLRVECETGVGLDGGVVPGTDPQISLWLSDDGGQTYGPALRRSLGPRGQHKHVVEWRALGSSRDRRCMLEISDPVKVAITGFLTDVKALAR